MTFETSGIVAERNDTTAQSGDRQECRDLVSIVVPCFNEQEILPRARFELLALAKRLDFDEACGVEFILVDDGSTDRTWPLICDWARGDPTVVGIRLSRNFGHQAALACGYKHCRGDAIACLDSDLQDPPDAVVEMIRAWRDGADVVLGVRRTRSGETQFKLLTASAFYWLIRKCGAKHVRPNVGDFRLLSRRALAALLQLTDSRPFFREMVGWIGFSTAEVNYDRQPRAAGVTKYTLVKMVRLAVDAIVGSTTRPLLFPWLAAIILLLPGLVVPGVSWLLGEPFTPSAVVIFTACTLILIGQGLQGLYLSRLYENGRGRPIYIVAEVASHSGVQQQRAPSETTGLVAKIATSSPRPVPTN